MEEDIVNGISRVIGIVILIAGLDAKTMPDTGRFSTVGRRLQIN
jgi:hypothetical protein